MEVAFDAVAQHLDCARLRKPRSSFDEQVADVVTQRISRLEGIKETETLIAFRNYSPADDAAAFEGFDG